MYKSILTEVVIFFTSVGPNVFLQVTRSFEALRTNGLWTLVRLFPSMGTNVSFAAVIC